MGVRTGGSTTDPRLEVGRGRGRTTGAGEVEGSPASKLALVPAPLVSQGRVE